jgi:Dolichyl-phosphate-mannose-protein mannosyltransferase
MGLAHSLSPIILSHGGGQRANQLYPLLIAPFWGPFNNVTAFRLVHAWNALLLASAAIPTYLLARELLARRWTAYLAAALVALCPWLTLSLAELTEVAAFPACVLALLAMQRALSQPSPLRDLIALGAIALAAYGRLQLLMLAPVFVVAMLVHEFGYALAARRPARELLRRLTRSHCVLSALSLLALAVGIPLLLSGTLANIFGFYGNTLQGVTLNGATLDLARSYFVFIALGIGLLPAALTIGFVTASLVAPVSRRAHAFASLTLITVPVLTLQVAEVSVRFEESVLQERYLFYIAPLLAVGMCAALMLSRHRLQVAAIGTLVLALLLGSTQYQPTRAAFWYEVSPAMTGFYDWIAPLFGAAGSPRADPGAARLVLAGVILLAVGGILAILTRRVSASRLLAGVGAVVVVLCTAQTVHALWHVVHGTASGKGYGQTSLRGVEWVDRSAPSHAQVAQLISNVGGFDASRGLWEDTEFWNRVVTGAYSFGDVIDSFFATPRLKLDPGSGRIVLAASSRPVGPSVPYLVVPSRGFPVGVAGSPVASSPDGKLALVRVQAPLHAAWALAGISSNGWLPLTGAATLRIYSFAVGGCERIGVSAALTPLASTPRRLLLAAPGIRREVTFAPGATHTAQVRICGESPTSSELRLVNLQSATASDPQITLQLRRVTVSEA